MDEQAKKESPNPVVAVASYCGGAAFAIALVAFLLKHPITDGGMWALAAMVAAPCLMGVGLAYFLCKQRD
jgi:hypothetical protein